MATEISEAVAAMIVERSAQRRSEWAKRRQERVQLRAERKTARDAGLVARHAAKLLTQQQPAR
jgi:hypothetical protein